MKLVKVKLETEKKFSNKDAGKLRGYIGNRFRENIYFHNHIDEVTFNYDFAYIQYKVINGELYIFGIDKGGDILLENVELLKEIIIEGERIGVKPIVNITFPELVIEEDKFYRYKFETLWFALNSRNYERYKAGEFDLNRQLANNVLEFLKMCGVWADKRVIVKGDFKEHPIIQKDTKIIGFYGEFEINIDLPSDISLGKRKTVGLGRIKKI